MQNLCNFELGEIMNHIPNCSDYVRLHMIEIVCKSASRMVIFYLLVGFHSQHQALLTSLTYFTLSEKMETSEEIGLSIVMEKSK